MKYIAGSMMRTTQVIIVPFVPIRGISKNTDAREPSSDPMVLTANMIPIRPERPLISLAYNPVPSGKDNPMRNTGTKPIRRNTAVVKRESLVKVEYSAGIRSKPAATITGNIMKPIAVLRLIKARSIPKVLSVLSRFGMKNRIR